MYFGEGPKPEEEIAAGRAGRSQGCEKTAGSSTSPQTPLCAPARVWPKGRGSCTFCLQRVNKAAGGGRESALRRGRSYMKDRPEGFRPTNISRLLRDAACPAAVRLRGQRRHLRIRHALAAWKALWSASGAAAPGGYVPFHHTACAPPESPVRRLVRRRALPVRRGDAGAAAKPAGRRLHAGVSAGASLGPS
jgi:hypothetical protein